MNDDAVQTGILIVEDSPTQAEELKYILEKNNYEVRSAENGRAALDILQKWRPDIVVSDIMMPEMDGYQLCKNMRSDSRLRDIPVILLTSLSDPRDVIKGLESGANNFIIKPYDERHLLARIKYLQTNLQLRKDMRAEMGINIYFAGEHFFITAERMQILDLLLSTYENAYLQNCELRKTQEELNELNEELETKVRERTAKLEAEMAERKRAEEEVREVSQQLWQATKLATVGELAASIAHELNNPLATISLRVDSMLAQTGAEDRNPKALEVVSQEIDRMSNLVANLLQFSRRSTQQISTVNVQEEIEKTLELIYYHLRKRGINIARDFLPEPGHVHADRQQLRQLFLNLFTNAGDAMPSGGTLTIKVTDSASDVNIEILDTGTGIAPENLKKIMEPFFTTKTEGKGTGLGLPICKRIVEEHKGELEITSELGKGTRVSVSLPRSNGHNANVLTDA